MWDQSGQGRHSKAEYRGLMPAGRTTDDFQLNKKEPRRINGCFRDLAAEGKLTNEPAFNHNWIGVSNCE